MNAQSFFRRSGSGKWTSQARLQRNSKSTQRTINSFHTVFSSYPTLPSAINCWRLPIKLKFSSRFLCEIIILGKVCMFAGSFLRPLPSSAPFSPSFGSSCVCLSRSGIYRLKAKYFARPITFVRVLWQLALKNSIHSRRVVCASDETQDAAGGRFINFRFASPTFSKLFIIVCKPRLHAASLGAFSIKNTCRRCGV